MKLCGNKTQQDFFPNRYTRSMPASKEFVVVQRQLSKTQQLCAGPKSAWASMSPFSLTLCPSNFITSCHEPHPSATHHHQLARAHTHACTCCTGLLISHECQFGQWGSWLLGTWVLDWAVWYATISNNLILVHYLVTTHTHTHMFIVFYLIGLQKHLACSFTNCFPFGFLKRVSFPNSVLHKIGKL